MKRVLVPIVILGSCIAFSYALIRTPLSLDEVALEIIPVSVRVTEVEQRSVGLVVGSQGKVQAAQTANLSAAVAGPVAWISSAMEAGGYVTEGETLLRLDASDYETMLARSEASVQQANAESGHASREYDRMKELAEQRLASQSQLQDAQRLAEVSIARLADAEANHRQAQLDLQRTEIKAPFNAIVETREVELGQYVNRAQSIAVLYGANEVEVRVPLAIRQLGYLDIPLGLQGELPPEQAPAVTLTGTYGGAEHHWEGTLVRIEASIDPNSNTVQTIIRVSQPTATIDWTSAEEIKAIPLPIGLYVHADIKGKTVDSLISLPRSVIRNNNQVLVVDAENKMYYREVDIFRLEEENVLISGGILPGERVCISPIQAVVDGMAVQPILELI
jgi:RND family efflux transporter MFP subunit|tara:strand:+ start:6342 stop:7514 length:1173 start_codon:yes stop_codon:yes gene_type:complete